MQKTMVPRVRLFGRLFLFCLASLLAGASVASAEDVALTFDDLPTYGPRGSIDDATRTMNALIKGLTRHHLPAIGFVNEIQLDGADRNGRVALLSHWLDAGLELGNHSYSHLSLNKTPVEAYIADVARGEAVTRGLLAARGQREHWYRYPYLETGLTTDIRHRFEGWLAEHGYRVAPVTMEASDWAFADRYDEALARHDQTAARRIQSQYLDFTTRSIAWYRTAALGLLSRHPSFVLLLHASRLNAASIDALARILKQQKLHAVSIESAMTDPAYTITDTYVGPDGDEWLTRWSLTLHKDLPWATLPRLPTDIAQPTVPAPAP
jgi:peptidoglycan/xylan/chitin deacetylase (PgdA/CDA1 family)